MLRYSIVRSSRSLASFTRAFSISARILAEGDSGSSRSAAGGVGGDAFSKREQANENQYIREQEHEKLELLKNKLQEQKTAIDELTADIDKMKARNSKK